MDTPWEDIYWESILQVLVSLCRRNVLVNSRAEGVGHWAFSEKIKLEAGGIIRVELSNITMPIGKARISTNPYTRTFNVGTIKVSKHRTNGSIRFKEAGLELVFLMPAKSNGSVNTLIVPK